jgi:chromate transporter
LLLLFGGGVLVMVIRNGLRAWMAAFLETGFFPRNPVSLILETEFFLKNSVSTLTTLFLTFLKIGAVLYGSGYVLVAFLQAEFVERLGWISSAQLLDAVAIGQITPGPVFTTATFIGYLTAGLPGAVVATVGIFLPGFVFVAVTNPFIPRMRRSPWLAGLLDGIVAASLGLMAAVMVELARAAIVDATTALIGLTAAVLLIRFRVNSTWLILGGAAVGLVLHS